MTTFFLCDNSKFQAISFRHCGHLNAPRTVPFPPLASPKPTPYSKYLLHHWGAAIHSHTSSLRLDPCVHSSPCPPQSTRPLPTKNSKTPCTFNQPQPPHHITLSTHNPLTSHHITLSTHNPLTSHHITLSTYNPLTCSYHSRYFGLIKRADKRKV